MPDPRHLLDDAIAVNAPVRELQLSRLLSAPRTLVFKALTEPARMVQWWGPRGFVTHSCTVDLRPGGSWRLRMRRADGVEHWLHGVYEDIVEPERLVTSWAWEPGETEFTDWLPGGVPHHETRVTLILADEDGKTRLTLKHAFFESDAARDSHTEGWSEALDRLDEHLTPEENQCP